MTSHSKKILLISIAVISFIVAGVILGYGALQRFWTARSFTTYPVSKNTALSHQIPIFMQGSEIVSRSEVVPAPVLSEAGTLPYGFPSTLITEKGIAIIQSFRIDNAEKNYTELFVQYGSYQPVEKNQAYFSNYLQTYGWNILKEHEYEGSLQFDAVKGDDGMSILVDLAKTSDATDVRINYYQRGAETLKSWIVK